VPEEIDHEHLYGLTWSPKTLIEALRTSTDKHCSASGVRRDHPTSPSCCRSPFPTPNLLTPSRPCARRAGSNARGLPRWASPWVLPKRECVPEWRICRQESPRRWSPARCSRRWPREVWTTSASQDAAWVTSRDHPWQRAEGDGRVRPGDLVALSAGALANGYVGEVGRTLCVGDDETEAVRALYRRSDALGNCCLRMSAGAVATDLFAAYEAAGEPLRLLRSRTVLGWASTAGPVTGPPPPAAEHLDSGMVLAVTNYVWQQGIGAVFRRDAVCIDDDGRACEPGRVRQCDGVVGTGR